MKQSTPQNRRRATLAGALGMLLVSLSLAASAQATEYHRSVWDITTNMGRSCAHGLNGAPGGAVSFYLRDVYTETSIGCNYGSAGIPTGLWTNLYLYSDYGTEVEADGWHLGYGDYFYNGSSSAFSDYNHVEAWNRVYNIPTRFDVNAWTTYKLPTSQPEDFTSWPNPPDYHCSAYWRLHDGLVGWHLSGLTCSGDGIFTTGVAPYLN